jgi:hypothetical protein
MKPIELDHIKAAWKNESSFEDKKLSESDILDFLHGRSKDMNRLFTKGLIFDIVLKTVIGISLLGIILLFRTNPHIILMVSVILLGTIWTIFFQGKMIGRIPETTGADPVIRTTLENKVKFYRLRYIKSLYVGALSNALIILAGSLYYFYFKYGEIRPFQWDDYLVLGAVILIGFALGAYAQIAQHNFQVKQLESCLKEIDEDSMTPYTISQQRSKKRRMILILVLAILCGLLVLAFLIFR